ncbi:MAG: YraN family protein [Pseudomonadota bacterium]|jgi:TIGR00252 family protein|nr:MAG: YraN family protein [Pseudomonadota bacterium]
MERPRPDRREIGRRAEDVAAEFLVRHGLTILTRNFRRRLGELDLVAREGDVLVVAEVRTRSSDEYGGAAASVDGWKRRRIVRATLQLLQRHRDLSRLRVRFDVIVVSDPFGAIPKVEWIRHAFEA